MALPPSASPPPAPGAQPPGGAPAQAPFGGSPAVTPTPNKGFEMAGKQKVAMAVKVLQDALPMYGASSEDGQIVLECLRKLGKLAMPGDVSPAGMQNGLMQQMLKAAQAGQQQKQMAAPPQGGAPGGAPPQAPPAAAA
jgi:hypothetical protein